MKVGGLEIDIVANLVKLRNDLDKATGMVQSTAKRINSIVDDTKRLMVGLFAGFTVAAFASFVRGAIDAADQLNKLAQRTGMATEQLSQLRYAARLADVSNEALTQGIKKLNISIAESLSGDKQKMASFKAIGITQETLKKGTLETMFAISDAYAKARDGAGKTENAVKLMGKAGDEMIPMLNGGRDAIIALMKEADRLGLTISSDFAQRAEEFNDNLTRIRASTENLAIAFADNLVKSLSLAISKMTEATLAGGKLQGIITFVQTFLTGDDRHKANVEMVETAEEILRIQNAMDKIKSKGANMTAGDANALENLKKELKVKQDQYNTARNYAAMLDQEAESQSKAADAAKRARTEGVEIQKVNEQAQSQYESLIKRIRERIDVAEQEKARQRELTDEEKFATKVASDLRDMKGSLTSAQQAEVDALMKTSAALFQENQQREKKLKLMQAQYEYEQQIAEEQMANDAADSKERMRVALSIDEQTQALQESSEALGVEARAVGLNAQQREALLEKLRIQQKLQKDLNELDRNYSFDESQREIERERLRNNAEIAKQQVDIRKGIEEQISMVDTLERTAHDTWTNIESDGVSAFKNIGRAIKAWVWDLLYQITVKRWVLAISANVVGGGSAAAPGGAAGALNSGSNMLSSMNNYSNLLSGNNFMNGEGMLGGIGTSLFGSAGAYASGVGGLSAAGAGSQAAMLAAQTGEFGAAGLAMTAESGAVAAGAGTTALGTAASGFAAAIPVIGWIVAIAALLYSFLGKSGGPKTEGYYNPYNSDAYYSSQNNEVMGAAKKMAGGLQANYDSLVRSFGGQSGLQFGLGFSMDPIGDAPTQLHIGAGSNGNSAFNLFNANAGRDEKDLQDAVAKLSSRAMLLGLQQANLGGVIGNYLNQYDFTSLSDDNVAEVMARIQKASQERANLEEQIYQMTHGDLEKLTRTRERERDAIDESNRELLDHVYALQDAQSAAGKAYAAMQQAAQKQFESMQDLRDLSELLGNTLKSFTTDPVLGMDRSTAFGALDNALATARNGGKVKAADLQDALGVITRFDSTGYSSFADYVRAYDEQAAKIKELKDLTDGQLTAEEKYYQDALDAAQKQLDALMGIDNTILTFAQAQQAFNDAIAKWTGLKAEGPKDPVTGGGYTEVVRASVDEAARKKAEYDEWLRSLVVTTSSSSGGYSPEPGYAVGTNYVPYDMMTMVHEGERIIPKSDNPYANPYTSDDQSRSAGQICASIESFAYEQNAANIEIIATLKDMRRVIVGWDENGQPGTDPDWTA